MEQDTNLQNQAVDPQRNLVTKLINHYEPNVEVTDDYYKSISEKYQDVDTLVTKLINHYEPKAEVTTDYLNALYSKYDVKKKEQTEPTQAAPLPGLGGVSEEPTPSPSVGQGVLRDVDQTQPRGEAFISQASDLTRPDVGEPQVDSEDTDMVDIKLSPKDAEYIVDGKKVDKTYFKDFLYERDNAQAIFDGRINISVKNDPEMEQFASRQVQSRETNDVWDSLKSGVITIGSSVLGAQQMVGDFLEDLTGIQPTGFAAMEKTAREAAIKDLQEKAKEAQESRFQADGDFIDLVSNGDFSEAGNMAVNTVVESGPLSLTALAATAATGNPMAGFAVLAPITTGMTYSEQMTTEDEAIRNLSDTEKYLRATAFGLAEAGSEAISGKILGRSFKLFGKGVSDMVGRVASEFGEQAATDVAVSSAKKTISEIMKNYGLSMAEEGAAEGLTQLTQNLTDAFLGVKDMSLERVLEGVGNAIALGAASGGIMSTPGAAGQAISGVSKKVLDYKLSKKNGAEELTSEAKRMAEFNKIFADNLSDIESNIESRSEAVNATPNDMVSDTETVDLVEEKQKLEKEIEGKDPILTDGIKKRVGEINEELKKKAEAETVPAKQKGRLTKFSTPQDGIVGEVTYEDGTKKELTQEEYDALEKQEGLFDVETGTQPVAETAPTETPSEVVTEKVEKVSEAEAVEPTEEVTDEAAILKEAAPVEKTEAERLDARQKTKFEESKRKADDAVKAKEDEIRRLEDEKKDALSDDGIKKPSRGQDKVYLSAPSGDGTFSRTYETKEQANLSFFEVVKTGEKTADIYTIDNESIQKRLINTSYVEDWAESDNDSNGTTSIEVLQPAKAVLDGEVWRITEKMKIHFKNGSPKKYDIGVSDTKSDIKSDYDSKIEKAKKELTELKKQRDAIQEQAAGKLLVQPKAKAGEKVEKGKPEAEPEKPTQEGKEEVSEEEKVKAAKDNLNNVWEKWKQSQKNLGVVFDPKSKANEDMELLEAFLTYIKALGVKTAKDIQKAFNDFTGGEATLDDVGAEFVSESVKEPVTKKTEKELSREVTFTNIYDIIEKVNKRTPKKANPKEVNKRAYENAYDYLLKSDWFASATDIEQTEAIDDLKKLTGQRRESSPSAQKILGIDTTKEKISVDQKTIRGWMMKDLAQGYKLGKRDAKKVMAAMLTLKSGLQRELVAAMREIKSSGKLTKKQVDAIVNKFQKTNVFNPDAVETFLNYIQKVVDNADYVEAVKTANTTRKQIKRRMKNKDVDNNLVQAAKEFAKINPSKVDDIDAYNQLAEKIKEGLGFSMNSKQGVKFRSAFDISTVEEYSELELKIQKLASDAAFEEMFKEMYGLEERAELVNKIKELKDSITPDNKESVSKKIKDAESELEEYDRKNFGMTVSEMRDFYAELDKETEKDEVKDKETRAKQAMSGAVKAFDTYSAIINEMLESGVDLFTGEDLDVDSKTKELIKEFMDIDISKLTLKDALRSVDALNNFVVNQTTGGLEAIIRKRRGEENVNKLVKDGVRSFKLKLPFGSGNTWITGIVESYLNSFASLPNLLDNMFGGVRASLKVEKAIGFSDIVNGRAAANKKANQILEQFLDKFSDKEANGQDFNTASNMTERGILGFMRRTVLSKDEKLRKDEFERRKNLIKESIDRLKEGSKKDVEKAKIYEEVYNKLLNESNSIEEVESKVDPVNKEAVEWWSEKFNEILPKLTETSINVYNTVLENESNYNPDVYKRLNEQDSELTGLDDDSYSSNNGNEKVYDKKNPMLMRVKKPSLLPPGRYVSLDFEVNNFNSYESALVDINTASAIQQLKGALESDAFNQLVPDYSDRKILKDRITAYVAQIRGKGGVPQGKLWNKINDISNIFARIGTATSLGGILQPAKQTLPVFVNTLINSGMSPEVFKSLTYVFDKDISSAINNSGMPIANRGALSETTIDDFDKKIDKLQEYKGVRLFNAVKKMQDLWMKKFLQEPDAFIARASFLVYYKQDLNKKGIDTSKIDWKNHKWNKDSANFAQRMVDRQQNVSDSDLQGAFLTDRVGASPIIRKILLPFQNFVLNQKNRMYSDIRTLENGSKEDKVIAMKSLLGLSAEWASFTIISIGIQEGMYMAAEELISRMKEDEDDDEAKKKRAKEKERRRQLFVRGAVTSAIKDFVSPLPLVDEPMILVLNSGLEKAGASMDKGGFSFGVDFEKSMYETYEDEVKYIDDEKLKFEKSMDYLSRIIESQKKVDGEMYDVHKDKINEFNKRFNGRLEYTDRITKDVEKYMKKIEVDQKPFQLYEAGKGETKMTDFLGSVGIGFDRMGKSTEIAKQALSLEYEQDVFGKKTVKKIPKELQQALFIAAVAQLGSSFSLFPSEFASTANKIHKLVLKEAKSETQLESERRSEIEEIIKNKDPKYYNMFPGDVSSFYSSANSLAISKYKKRLTDMNDEEINKVLKESGLR